MLGFKGLVAPVTARPDNGLGGSNVTINLLRDQFTIQSWLAIGALVQGALLLLFGTWALVPAASYMFLRTVDTYLVTIGWKSNELMKDVLLSKTSAQLPDDDGRFSGKAADAKIVVFLVGMRNNHPLGLLAPGMKQLGEYFGSMAKSVYERAEEYNYLGGTSWINTSERSSRNELLNVMYFKDYEGLHKFAHSDLHKEGWKWYTDIAKKHTHLAVFHETYEVPKGHWETVYVNAGPTLLGTTASKFVDDNGEEKFASTIVDASKGVLRTSKGRMDRSNGSDNDKDGY